MKKVAIFLALSRFIQKNLVCIASIALGTLFVGGRALAYEKVTCFTLSPPDLVLADVRRIAALKFDGSGGGNASDKLISWLLKDKRGIYNVEKKGLFSSSIVEGRTHQDWATTRIFDIVERSQLERIMQEQALGASGMIDDTQAAELGRILGVDAIISGSVQSEHNDNYTTEERYSLKKGASHNVRCLNRKVITRVKVRIISVKTGQILGNKEFAYNSTDKQCGEDEGAIASIQSLSDRTISSATYDAASYISPTFSLYDVELAKLKTKQFRDKADDAAKFAANGELDRAYLLYYAIYQEDSYNHLLLYNLGILNEAVGNYTEAKEMYENALSLKSDEKDYMTALTRVQKLLDFAEVLTNMGIPVTRHEWDINEAAVIEASARKIVVKGKYTDRQEVRQSPKTNSAVVAKVPGGVELTLLSREGNWFKVKLIGDKEGYLEASQVKEIK